jgi:Aldehyde dehydrogenase family
MTKKAGLTAAAMGGTLMSAISIDAHEAVARTLPPDTSFVDGKALKFATAQIYDHINPATGRKQAEIALAGAKEVDLAVAAAQHAFPLWRATKPAERAELLHRFADFIDQNKERIAKISAIENGPPYNIVQTGHWPIVMGWLKYYAGYADKIEGAVTASYPSESFEYTIPEPFGVIGNVITWNAPMISLAFKVTPSLAAGCTTVVKPSEITPFTAMLSRSNRSWRRPTASIRMSNVGCARSSSCSSGPDRDRHADRSRAHRSGRQALGRCATVVDGRLGVCGRCRFGFGVRPAALFGPDAWRHFQI